MIIRTEELIEREGDDSATPGGENQDKCGEHDDANHRDWVDEYNVYHHEERKPR